MKKLCSILLAAALLLMAAGCSVSGGGADSSSLSMGTGGDTGTYYAVGGALAHVIGQNTGKNIHVVSTGGSKDNLISMEQGLYQLATVQSDVMTYAYEGRNTFAESGALQGFRALCALYAETVQIVTCDPELNTVEALRGKTVCVGDVGSGTYYNTLDILAAYGMTPEDITPVYQSFGDSAESLKDGKIDAAFLCAGAPTPAITELAAARSVRLISMDDDHMARLLEQCPYYAEYSIPAGTYGNAEPAKTVTVKATLIAFAGLSEEDAYAITKCVFDHRADIAALHAKGAELDLHFATDGITVPFSPGAARYFAEQGITVRS